jgi:hypothetical protein
LNGRKLKNLPSNLQSNSNEARYNKLEEERENKPKANIKCGGDEFRD